MAVKLLDLVENLELVTDEILAYLNTQTGEVITVTLEDLRAAEEDLPLTDYPDWQQEAIEEARQVLESDNLLALPDKYEIYEYDIMRRFCDSKEDYNLSDEMAVAIRGRGAFRRFKDKIRHYNLEEQWYSFHFEALKEVAIRWCQDNGLDWED